MRILIRWFCITSVSALMVMGCKKEEEQQPAAYPQQQAYPQQAGYQQQPAGYPQQQPAAYPQQQPAAYPQQQPAAYPQQQPAAQAAPQAASPQPMALATPCTKDGDCIGAKCNMQVQKCQFPCGSNADCQPNFACQMGACLPAAAPPMQ